MIVIIKKQGENRENLFRKFYKQSREENISFDVTKKMFYKKPSFLKKEKEKERLKRLAQKRRYGKNLFPL